MGSRAEFARNIAAGFGTVDATFNTWQASGGHYASIVSGTTEAGFGYAISPNGGTYWVGVYGSPAKGTGPAKRKACGSRSRPLESRSRKAKAEGKTTVAKPK